MISVLAEYSEAFVIGIRNTFALALLTILISTIFAIILVVIARSSRIARVFVVGIIQILISLPVLVLLIWTFYALPLMAGIPPLNPFAAALVALSLSLTAFLSDIILSGVSKVPKGQIEAAMVNFGNLKPAIWKVLLPHGLRLMSVPIIVQFITTIKFTTLASIIGFPEILHIGSDIIQDTYKPLVIYSIIALLFVSIIIPLNLMTRWLEASLYPEKDKV